MRAEKHRVLFLCTHNSARSQMAEGWLRHLAGDRFEAFSAGTVATAVNPLAMRVMAEVGVDISGHRSKTWREFEGSPFDLVVTVCDNAAQQCPSFPGPAQRVHCSVRDPGEIQGNEAEQLGAFRQARDALRSAIEALIIRGREAP